MGLLSSIKSIMFILLVALFFIRTKFKISRKIIILTMLFIIVLLFQILNSYHSSFFEKETFFEFKSFIGLYVNIIILVYSIIHNFISAKLFLQYVIVAHIFYLSAKLFLIIGFFLKFTIASTLIEILSNILNANILAYGIIPKITLINDILTPIILLILILNISLKDKLFNKTIQNIIIFVALLSIFLAFNRFNIALLFTGLIIYLFIIDKKKIFYIIGIFLLIFSLLNIIDNPIVQAITEIWSNRLSAEGSLSTSEKSFQYNLFFERIQNNFLFGNGLGTFLTDYIRDDNIRYGYEAFIMIIFYQFGLINFLFLIVIYFAFYILHFKLLKNRYLLFNFILSIFILSVSLVNPMLLNSMFSIVYVLVISNFIFIRKSQIIKRGMK